MLSGLTPLTEIESWGYTGPFRCRSLDFPGKEIGVNSSGKVTQLFKRAGVWFLAPTQLRRSHFLFWPPGAPEPCGIHSHRHTRKRPALLSTSLGCMEFFVYGWGPMRFFTLPGLASLSFLGDTISKETSWSSGS